MAGNVKRGGKGRHKIPFIFADYARPDEVQTRAQEYFLWVVHGRTPAPLYRLRDEVFPKFRAAFDLERSRAETDDEIKKHACQALVDVMLKEEIDGLGALVEYQAVWAASRLLYDATDDLISWANRFNLRGRRFDVGESKDPDSLKSARIGAIWPVVAALETIFDWHFAPLGSLRKNRSPPLWRAPVRLFKGPPKDPEILPTIRLKAPVCNFPRSEPSAAVEVVEGTEQASWDAEFEPEEQFRSRIRYLFELWLNRYVESKKVAARDAGLVEVPGKRELDHFCWTARYQIDQAYISTIARENNKTEKAVEQAIEHVLELISLEKRPGRRGPPRQPKASRATKARDHR